MRENHSTIEAHDTPEHYEIRLKGLLDARWADRFEGMSLIHEGNGITLLRGSVVDQAGLHGLLRKIRDVGIPLISVTCVESKPFTMPDVNSGDRPREFTNGDRSMNKDRTSAFIVGALFILAAVTAIIGFMLYGPVLNDPNYIVTGTVHETQVIWGAFFEIVVAISLIGISITMFPILKRYNESLAIGYVCFRLLESTIIIMGILSILSVVTLSHEFVKTATVDTASFLTVGKLLVAFHDWTFLFGPNVALGPSTLMMSYLLYKSKLVPRFIAVLGLIGGPLIFTSAMFVMFGVYGQNSSLGAIAALPVFAYEMSLGTWLVIKGFNRLATAGTKDSVAINPNYQSA